MSAAGVFAEVEPPVRAELIRAGSVRTYPKGALLWRHSQRVKFAYVVLSGRIGVLDITGEEFTVIDLFQPGTVIAGGPALEEDMPYLFSGKAVDEVRTLTIPIELFRRQVSRSHSLLFNVALNIVHQWRRIMFQVRNLKQLSADQRLGFYLLTLTERRSGTAIVHLADDQLLIAGIVGVTRESLSRCFARLHAYGVRKRGRRVTMGDVRKLRAFCESDPIE